MKKLTYLFLALLIVACSDDEGNPCLYNPTLTTSAVTNITETSATLNGVISIVSENCDNPTNTEQGFVYATTIQPTTANNKVNVNGTDITTTLENLEPNTTYYVRTFLTNALGEFYGNEVSFTTSEEQLCVYNLNTQDVTEIITTSAVLIGTIITEDIENCELPNTEQGFVYSTEVQPTIEDTQVNVNGTDISTTLENLEPNTTYYARTFLTNALGEFYGNEVSFMTIDGLINCDDNLVPTVVYGTQEWSVENACNITYRDGTPIPQVTDDDEWVSLTTGAWSYYNNDPTKHRLYNWYAVVGIHDADPNTPNKEFAPEGWHVPSDDEWTSLKEHLIANGYNYDGTTTENKIAKSMASTTGWNSATNTGAVGNDQSLNNSSGFNAFPEGFRFYNGMFYAEGNDAFFWSSTESDTGGNCVFDECAWILWLGNNTLKLWRFEDGKREGVSVRFVRD